MGKIPSELGAAFQHSVRNRSLWNNWNSQRGGGTAPTQKYFDSEPPSLSIRSTRIRGVTADTASRPQKNSQPSYSKKLQAGSRLTSEPLRPGTHGNVPSMGWARPKGSAPANTVPALVSRGLKIRQSSMDTHTATSRVESSRGDRRPPGRLATSTIRRPSAPSHRPLRLEGFEWLLENTDALVHQRQHHQQRPIKPQTSRPESRVESRTDSLDFKLTSRAIANARNMPRPSAPNSAASRSRRCWRLAGSPRNVTDIIPSSSDEESSPQDGSSSFRRFQERRPTHASQDTDNVANATSMSQLRSRYVRPPSRQKPPPQALHLDLQTFKLSLDSEDTPKIPRGIPSNRTSRNKYLARRHHGYPKIAFSEKKN